MNENQVKLSFIFCIMLGLFFGLWQHNYFAGAFAMTFGLIIFMANAK